ncbi:MAG: histidine phosphatase family protein [Rikenellaceae bacterium]
MVKLFLQRHTQPDVDAGVCYGVSDVPLATDFEQHHLPQVMDRLRGVCVEKIYSSPLQRCNILARRIQESLNIKELTIDRRLMELNFGEWELTSWDDIFASDRGKEWFDDYLNCQPPKGEAFVEMIGRAESFLTEITSMKNSTVLCVTHSGFMRAVLVASGRVTQQKAFDIKIEYGDLMKIQI